MKRYILPVLLLSVSLSYAQSKREQKADQLYNSYQYAEAVEAYTKLANKSKADDAIYQKLADSHYMLAQYQDASTWYGKLSTIDDAELCYRYVQSLRASGNTAKANEYMNRFVQLAPNDSRAVAFKKNPNYLSSLSKPAAGVTIKESKLNSKNASDFSAVLSSDNKAYFVSNRGGGHSDSWSDGSYVSIYTADLREDGNYGDIELLNDLRSKFHDGPVTLSSDGKTMYFARDGHASKKFKKNKKNQVKIGQQGIYKAVNENGKWREVEAMPFNSTEYSVTHPALSSDGKTLYFSSNMPGSIGTADIWKVSIHPDGSYGKPENLGSKVNTSGREVFPFVTDQGQLYFSSDGHLGMGGLDIFRIDLKSNGEVENLGVPYNSSSDDFGYSEQGDLAYFSTARSGRDNIYEANVLLTTEVKLLIVDTENDEVLSGASVTWKPLSESPSQSAMTTDSDGVTTSTVHIDSAYNLIISKSGYETIEYKLHVNEKNPTRIIGLKKVIKEVAKEKMPIVFNDIYFAFDSSVISNEAAKELDEVVRILQEDGSLEITIRSHTDAIGTSDYNKQLSERRAKATKDYLLKKGVSSLRIFTEGVGSELPKVTCEGPCPEKDRAQNRRSQIIVK